MNSLYVFFLCLFSTLNLFAQHEPCDSVLLNTEFAMVEHNEAELMAVIEAIKELGNCGLEEVNIEFLMEGPILGNILIAIVKDGSFILKDFLNYFNEIKNSEGFLAIRDDLLKKKRISSKIANLENWEADKLVFKMMGARDKDLEQMESWIKASDGTLTYKDLVEKNSQE